MREKRNEMLILRITKTEKNRIYEKMYGMGIRSPSAYILMFRLTEKKLVTESITLEIGYDRENVDKGGYRGLTQTDRYGRVIPKAAHGTIRFDAPTNLGSTLINESAKLFERITDPALTVRRITINANKVTPDEGIYQVDFFTDTKKLEKEKNSS
ncbi:MAG: hypothetical protein ACLVJH_00855 [Faecalibacterium prausnitzii]